MSSTDGRWTSVQDFKVDIIGPTGDCAVLQIAGELDAYTAPFLRDRMRDLTAVGVRHVIADLRQVSFLDSTGLGVLVGGLKRFREHGGSLAPVVTKSSVLKIFQITGLTSVLPPRSSVADAIDADPHWRQEVEAKAGSTAEWCRQHDLM
jgi:anti-sigma B factor antagonist